MPKITEEEIKKILPLKGPSFEEVKNYLEKYNDEYIVIKCGGSVLVDQNLFHNFINDISILNKLGFIPIIIHGGGKRISNKLNEAGIKSNFINGLRVTDEKVISIVEDVLVDFNIDIVNSLKKKGAQAVSITSKLNNIINVIPDDKELGFVGIPSNINTKILLDIINQKQIPIIAPLGIDKEKNTYNINGDTAASAIAKKLKSRRLLLMTNVEGVYDDRKNLISEIKPFDIENLVKLKIVQGGMIPKIKNCIDAVENGVRGVVILDGRKPHSILDEIFSDKGSGTLIRK